MMPGNHPNSFPRTFTVADSDRIMIKLPAYRQEPAGQHLSIVCGYRRRQPPVARSMTILPQIVNVMALTLGR